MPHPASDTPRDPDIGRMFDRAASRYDLLNTLLSWGRDETWRSALAATLSPGERVLDLCCGSGRSAAHAFRRTRRKIVGADVSWAMLAAGVAHAARTASRFAPVQCDGFRLPFRDRSFDAVVLAWGLRNLVPESDALREILRVLRDGGSLLVLDSPTPEPGWVGSLHRIYLRAAVPLLGRLSPDPEAYRYLARTILAFGRRGAVADRLCRAGLEVGPPEVLLAGAAAIWRGRKPPPLAEPAVVRNATRAAAGVAGNG